MTTDEKIQAVEEFLAWRENAHPTTAPIQLVETWRAALQAVDDAALLADIRKEAAFVSTSDEALALVERIARG
ncbi:MULTISPECIES: hypothetical protein [unclassified Microbacterium]|uniref:hypothetical protein n=1 Tax=unclassified Microbacterium TaxID=2609290 RepID=UPI0011C4820D|nr:MULTISPECIES: hypothetical protein [unclassified Microbacterium]MBT2484825.1 hypothetical protein [Microbacterium sp. ISL-108]